MLRPTNEDLYHKAVRQMNQQPKTDVQLLQIGDVVYDHDRWYGLQRYTIEKVTPKQAVYNNGTRRCNREVVCSRGFSNPEGTLIASKIGSYGSVELETPKLKAEYDLQQAKRTTAQLVEAVGKISVKGMSKEQVETLNTLLKDVLEFGKKG